MYDQAPAAPAEASTEVAEEGKPLDEARPGAVQTAGLGEVFEKAGISLLISTYEAGKLVVARSEGGQVNAHYRDHNRPMGIAVGDGQVAVGTLGDIAFYLDVPSNCARLDPPDRHDACYLQRYRHITGNIDVHEMNFDAQGRIFFINTKFSALCTIDGSTSFQPVWRPSFISRYAPEDRCHLNGLGMRDGQPRYVTALGETDTLNGWRERKADGGVLIDLLTDRILYRGLSMPHSPRWYANHLWVCESGKGELSRVDPATGELKAVFKFPGFTRGLDFFGPYAFVGISRVRETATFSGIPIADETRNCGVWIVNIVDGSHVGTFRFTQGVHEIFSVQVVKHRFPEFLDKADPVALDTWFLPPDVEMEMGAAKQQV